MSKLVRGPRTRECGPNHRNTHVRSMELLLGCVLCVALAGGLACDDPLSHLDRAKAALEAGRNLIAGGGDSTGDDEAGKAGSAGTSLGPNHAKRLYYQYVDSGGRVQFVERMSDVPEAWRARVGFVEMESPPPMSPEMAQNTRDQRFQKVAKQYRDVMPEKSAQIVLYSAEWCGWCKKARRHLDSRGIAYELRDIDRPEYLAELVEKTGQKGIPVLDVGGRVVTGFSAEQYDALIKRG